MSALAHSELVPGLPLREADAFVRAHPRHDCEDRRARRGGRRG